MDQFHVILAQFLGGYSFIDVMLILKISRGSVVFVEAMPLFLMPATSALLALLAFTGTPVDPRHDIFVH